MVWKFHVWKRFQWNGLWGCFQRRNCQMWHDCQVCGDRESQAWLIGDSVCFPAFLRIIELKRASISRSKWMFFQWNKQFFNAPPTGKVVSHNKQFQWRLESSDCWRFDPIMVIWTRGRNSPFELLRSGLRDNLQPQLMKVSLVTVGWEKNWNVVIVWRIWTGEIVQEHNSKVSDLVPVLDPEIWRKHPISERKLELTLHKSQNSLLFLCRFHFSFACAVTWTKHAQSWNRPSPINNV
jgi:hypothetical protein